MTLALASRWLSDRLAPAPLLALAEELDTRQVFLSAPVAQPALWRAALKAGGVSVAGVAAVAAAAEPSGSARLIEAIDCAAALKSSAVVVEGGAVGDDADVATREAAAERAVRVLHPLVARGVPLAIRNGAAAGDLLGFVETEWLLSELPELGLWVDPARALGRHRSGDGPAPEAWADAYAARVGGVFVHGLGPDGTGGGHPADDGPDWRSLATMLPLRVPWVLDLSPALSAGDVRDAMSGLRSTLGANG